MKSVYFILLLFSASISSYAQIDSESKSIIIPAEDVEDPKEDNELIVQPKEKNDVIPDDESSEVTLPKVEELPVAKRKAFTITNETEFRNPAELFQKQLQRSLKLRKDVERRHNGSSTTQYLGEFSTKAKRVNVIYRDHQYPDGDLIRVYVNGTVQQSRVLLETSYKGFFLNLKPGDNTIEFQALNQGTSGPNTAEFQVLDDKGVAISINQWNLATGVKATITIIKNKDEE